MSDMSDDDNRYRDLAKDTLRLALDQWWAMGAKENPTYKIILEMAAKLVGPDDEDDELEKEECRLQAEHLSQEVIDEILQEQMQFSADSREWARLVRIIRYDTGTDHIERALKADAKLAKFNAEMEMVPNCEALHDGSWRVELFKTGSANPLSEAAIEKALDWTRTHPEATEWANDAASANGGMGLMPWDLEAIVADLPKEVPLEVVMRVAKERTDRVRDGTIEEQPNTDDDWRAMTQAAGEALLKSAVEAAAVRERPTKASAGIALYNPELKLRVTMESSERDDDDEPTVGAPQRDEPAESALRMCKLVERDTWESLIARGDAPSRPPKRRLPFEIPVTHGASVQGFDVEGDLVTCCGDAAADEIRSAKNYVGMFTLSRSPELRRDCDTSPLQKLHTQPGGRGKWVSTVLAESRADGSPTRVWAVDEGRLRVTGYDCTSKQVAACLQFPAELGVVTAKMTRCSFGLTRCGDTLAGGFGTPQLFTWGIGEATRRYVPPPPTERSSERERSRSRYGDDSGDDDSDDEGEGEGESAAGMPPAGAVSLGKGFALGSCQRLTDTSCVVSGFDGEVDALPGRMKPYSSLRCVDLAAGRVSNVLVGHTETPGSLSRQLCAERDHLVFSSDPSGLALVFDLRSPQPVFTLPRSHEATRSLFGGGGASGILGVPLPSGPFAFTWGADECVRGWDLRNVEVACHAWTCATGNLSVESCAWHVASSALLVSTSFKHGLSYGRYGAYRYGERVDERADDGLGGDDGAPHNWPKGACHTHSYFPELYLNERAAILRYQFDVPRSTSLFANAARVLPEEMTEQLDEEMQERVKWERRVDRAPAASRSGM